MGVVPGGVTGEAAAQAHSTGGTTETVVVTSAVMAVMDIVEGVVMVVTVEAMVVTVVVMAVTAVVAGVVVVVVALAVAGMTGTMGEIGAGTVAARRGVLGAQSGKTARSAGRRLSSGTASGRRRSDLYAQ
jgi:hypothetical protein